MAKRRVFYSFHFGNDVMRVQQVRNMGIIDGDEPVSPNNWEKIKQSGDAAVKKWIDDNISGKSCAVVLIGSETASRPLVQYEIKKAWESGKGLFGIYIHNLTCPNNGKSVRGKNPFDGTTFRRGGSPVSIATYDPNSYDAYGDINKNLATWVETACRQVGV